MANSIKYFNGYKIKIYPTEEQSKKIDKYIELSRFIYNWTIERELKQYELYKNKKSDDKFLDWISLSYEIKEIRDKYPFLKDLPYQCTKNSMKNAINAFKNFFKGKSKFPKFKSKKRCKLSYKMDDAYFRDNKLKIAGLNGYKEFVDIKFHTNIQKNTKLYSGTVTKSTTGEYYFSYCLFENKPLDDICYKEKTEAIGIDLNVKNRFALSTGEIFQGPDTSKLINQIKRLQRKCQKDRDRYKSERTNPNDDIPLSNKANKRKIKLAKKYKKLHDINNTFHHTICKNIVMRNPEAIVMEDLCLSTGNKFIYKYTHYIGFYDIKIMMKHKCEKYNIPFILAPKDYKSTQLCSNCGHEKKMYSYKEYKCPHCGMIMNRDINAAKNLVKLAYI